MTRVLLRLIVCVLSFVTAQNVFADIIAPGKPFTRYGALISKVEIGTWIVIQCDISKLGVCYEYDGGNVLLPPGPTNPVSPDAVIETDYLLRPMIVKGNHSK